MSATGGLTGSSGHLDLVEISHLLESSNLNVISETVELVRDTLGSTTEPWLLNFLVEFYVQTGNIHARDLLCMVRQHQHRTLMNKIDDYLQKVSTRLKALSLLNHIIRNEPTWTHHILASRAFQSVLKCLQIDTDLPTITSALYVVATVMPKVASQVANYLPVICNIYIRLVSWHTIKPVGASEINLIHVHTAVYALFLCLYGMYPCYFLKHLQQYFQVGQSSKGGISDKEKIRIFENSVSPMLDQVRLHPGLITDSLNKETSNDRWRKVESQDIIFDISKIALDVTENPAAGATGIGSERKLSSVSDVNDISVQMLSSVCSKVGAKNSRASSDADGFSTTEQSQESLWSPSIAIGLSTPPLSRAMSPAPGSALQDSTQNLPKLEIEKSENDGNAEETLTAKRPLSLSMSLGEVFVPNRPHQTSSATSTPLKHLLPAFIFPSQSSSSQNQSPKHEMKKRKSNQKLSENIVLQEFGKEKITQSSSLKADNAENAFEQINVSTAREKLKVKSLDSSSRLENRPPGTGSVEDLVLITEHDLASKSVTSNSITDFTPGLQPLQPDPQDQPTKQLHEQDSSDVQEQPIPVHKLLNLKNSSKYIEKTPNELLDLHINLVAEAYDKYKDKFPVTSNKEIEWQIGDPGSGQPSPEVMYLRCQVLQMHCAMLYERHRRDQHALRARKLMRNVYDTTAMEEKMKTMSTQLSMKSNEIEEYRVTVKSCQSKLRSQEEVYKVQIDKLQQDLDTMNKKNEELHLQNMKLKQEKSAVTEECEALRTDVGQLSSKIFKLEHNLKTSLINKDLVAKMEVKIRELQFRLFESYEKNNLLASRVQDTKGESSARRLESQLLIDSYDREVKSLNEKLLNEQKALEVIRIKLEHAEANLQKERSIVSEQKKYLENVKSLARGQIKAMEAKYNAQKHICQRLEIQVMELFSRLSAIEGEMAVGDHTRQSSMPRSIHALSAVHSDNQYQHVYSSSPQLSPPMHGSLLADKNSTRSQHQQD